MGKTQRIKLIGIGVHRRGAAKMRKQYSAVTFEATIANQRQHPPNRLSFIDGISDQSFCPRKQANGIKCLLLCRTVGTFVGGNNLYVGWSDTDRHSNLCKRIIG